MCDIEKEYRKESRVPDHHPLRVKKIKSSSDDKWDVSTIRNMSKAGLLFYSYYTYETGSECEVRIMNPVLLKEISCEARVVRCIPVERMKNIYAIALEFTKIEPSSKEAFDKTIEFYLHKKDS